MVARSRGAQTKLFELKYLPTFSTKMPQKILKLRLTLASSGSDINYSY